jgi:hypothetical protein
LESGFRCLFGAGLPAGRSGPKTILPALPGAWLLDRHLASGAPVRRRLRTAIARPTNPLYQKAGKPWWRSFDCPDRGR